MDLDAIKNAVDVKIYHVDAEKKVPLHKHDKMDEIFYCIKGSGFGVLENSEVELTVGKAFIVPAGILHSLRSDGDLFVTAIHVPVVDERA